MLFQREVPVSFFSPVSKRLDTAFGNPLILLYFLEFSSYRIHNNFVLKVKLNDKLIAFLFCEALLSCDYYDDAKHYYAAAMMRSIMTMQMECFGAQEVDIFFYE